MKYIALIVTVCCLAFSSSSFADPKEKEGKKTTKAAANTAPLTEPKVSKKDAEHAILFKYRGANIEKIELVPGKGHANWRVDVFQSGARNSTQVDVDGMTGQIIEPGATTANASVPPAKKPASGMKY